MYSITHVARSNRCYQFCNPRDRPLIYIKYLITITHCSTYFGIEKLTFLLVDYTFSTSKQFRWRAGSAFHMYMYSSTNRR